MNFSLFVIFVIVVHCAQGKRYLQYIVNDKHNRISEIFDTYSRFASFSPLWCRTGRFKDFTLPIDIKRGILTNLKKNLHFKATHKFNPDFKSTLKSALIKKKNISCTFWRQSWFQGHLKIHRWVIFTMSHSWLLKRVVNDSLVAPSGC